MHSRRLRAGSQRRCWSRAAGPAAAADDVTLLRVFLTDGTALVSYGEPARIGDRVVFSMPDLCDAESAAPPGKSGGRPRRLGAHEPLCGRRARRSLHRDAGRARLRGAFGTHDAGVERAERGRTMRRRRLAIAENARKMLAAWPQEHYNYRLTEVRQMLSLLDEAIADLRAAAGDGRFDLSAGGLCRSARPLPSRSRRHRRRRKPSSRS